MSAAGDRWQRLSPLSPIVQLGRGSIAIAILVLSGLLSGHTESLWNLLIYGVLIPVGLVAGFVAWFVTRWRVHDGALQKEEGLIRRRSLRFPLAQIQAVDILRPGLARLLGLAELRLRMGGSTQSAGRLSYLRTDEALTLRKRLLDGVEEPHGEEQVAPAERVLFEVSTARLVLSWILDLRAIALIGTAIVTIVYAGPAASVIWLIPLAASVWRRANAELNLRVSEVAGGLHVEGGLVAVSAETIPRGRVQAVKLVEPLLLRPVGWCRLQVDLAGRERRDRRGGDTSSRSALTLVPVGTRRQADELVRYLLPDLPGERRRPPGRARLKSPLAYQHLAWGTNGSVVVATAGRLERITSWVPLEKVQSLRRVRGPVQRLLRLETIHLDTAGRGVHAALRDRDESEGEQALRDLVALCRQARREVSIAR